jgi:hypothetical protein
LVRPCRSGNSLHRSPSGRMRTIGCVESPRVVASASPD